MNGSHDSIVRRIALSAGMWLTSMLLLFGSKSRLVQETIVGMSNPGIVSLIAFLGIAFSRHSLVGIFAAVVVVLVSALVVIFACRYCMAVYHRLKLAQGRPTPVLREDELKFIDCNEAVSKDIADVNKLPASSLYQEEGPEELPEEDPEERCDSAAEDMQASMGRVLAQHGDSLEDQAGSAGCNVHDEYEIDAIQLSRVNLSVLRRISDSEPDFRIPQCTLTLDDISEPSDEMHIFECPYVEDDSDEDYEERCDDDFPSVAQENVRLTLTGNDDVPVPSISSLPMSPTTNDFAFRLAAHLLTLDDISEDNEDTRNLLTLDDVSEVSSDDDGEVDEDSDETSNNRYAACSENSDGDMDGLEIC